jgi:DNA-binding response OmpR family regulator
MGYLGAMGVGRRQTESLSNTGRIILYRVSYRGSDLPAMRILFVEDEPKVASFVRRGLEDAQHVVDLAPGRQEGLSLASQHQYDLFILDCMLPDGDGRDLCQELRSRDIGTPVLLLTAKRSTADKVAGLDSGADDYLTKPFDFSELLARVRALGRRREISPLSRLTIADLLIEPVKRRVTRSGEEITLTQKEYLLLELLARKAGESVTRAEMLEEVWDLHFDPGSNIVDVFIKILRDKIDRKFSPPLIHTVRGVGYRLSL